MNYCRKLTRLNNNTQAGTTLLRAVAAT